MQDANAEFRTNQGKSAPPASLFAHLCNCIMDFVAALDKDDMATCSLKRPEDSLPPVPPESLDAGNGHGGVSFLPDVFCFVMICASTQDFKGPPCLESAQLFERAEAKVWTLDTLRSSMLQLSEEVFIIGQ